MVPNLPLCSCAEKGKKEYRNPCILESRGDRLRDTKICLPKFHIYHPNWSAIYARKSSDEREKNKIKTTNGAWIGLVEF
jgi:hypothetical protein